MFSTKRGTPRQYDAAKPGAHRAFMQTRPKTRSVFDSTRPPSPPYVPLEGPTVFLPLAKPNTLTSPGQKVGRYDHLAQEEAFSINSYYRARHRLTLLGLGKKLQALVYGYLPPLRPEFRRRNLSPFPGFPRSRPVQEATREVIELQAREAAYQETKRVRRTKETVYAHLMEAAATSVQPVHQYPKDPNSAFPWIAPRLRKRKHRDDEDDDEDRPVEVWRKRARFRRLPAETEGVNYQDFLGGVTAYVYRPISDDYIEDEDEDANLDEADDRTMLLETEEETDCDAENHDSVTHLDDDEVDDNMEADEVMAPAINGITNSLLSLCSTLACWPKTVLHAVATVPIVVGKAVVGAIQGLAKKFAGAREPSHVRVGKRHRGRMEPVRYDYFPAWQQADIAWDSVLQPAPFVLDRWTQWTESKSQVQGIQRARSASKKESLKVKFREQMEEPVYFNKDLPPNWIGRA